MTIPKNRLITYGADFINAAQQPKPFKGQAGHLEVAERSANHIPLKEQPDSVGALVKGLPQRYDRSTPIMEESRSYFPKAVYKDQAYRLPTNLGFQNTNSNVKPNAASNFRMTSFDRKQHDLRSTPNVVCNTNDYAGFSSLNRKRRDIDSAQRENFDQSNQNYSDIGLESLQKKRMQPYSRLSENSGRDTSITRVPEEESRANAPKRVVRLQPKGRVKTDLIPTSTNHLSTNIHAGDNKNFADSAREYKKQMQSELDNKKYKVTPGPAKITGEYFEKQNAKLVEGRSLLDSPDKQQFTFASQSNGSR